MRVSALDGMLGVAFDTDFFCVAVGIIFSTVLLTTLVTALTTAFGAGFAGALATAFGAGFAFGFTTTFGAGFVLATTFEATLVLALALTVATRVPVVAFLLVAFAFAFAVTNFDSPETHEGRFADFLRRSGSLSDQSNRSEKCAGWYILQPIAAKVDRLLGNTGITKTRKCT